MANIYPHTNYVLPRDQLKRALENPARGRFIFVIGPAGVGKTTLRRALLRKICGNPASWGAGRIPYIEVFALLAQNAFFSSRGLAESLVQELFSPNLAWMRDNDGLDSPAYLALQREVDRAYGELRSVPLPKLPERAMWPKFQSLCSTRSVWLVAIDQAHALCTNHRNKQAADHILNLMSILERNEMNILLSGVHGAAELWATRPEVRRRSTVIWMAPYSHDRPGDRDPFLTVLRTLGEGYTFSKRSLLTDMADELMAASAGIFGVLSKILADAKERAELAGRSTIHKGDITDSYYGEVDYRKMWTDVRFFQEIMKSANTTKEATIAASAWGLQKKGKKDQKRPEPADSAETTSAAESTEAQEA